MCHFRAIVCAVALSLAEGWSFGRDFLGNAVGVNDGVAATTVTSGKDSVKVRLSGFDAPESKQAYGGRAKQDLSNLVFGRTVRVNVKARTVTVEWWDACLSERSKRFSPWCVAVGPGGNARQTWRAPQTRRARRGVVCGGTRSLCLPGCFAVSFLSILRWICCQRTGRWKSELSTKRPLIHVLSDRATRRSEASPRRI